MVEGRGGGKLADERRREFFTVSLFLSTRIERSCGNRAYLTYGGPAFGIIYGREGSNRSQKKRCPLPSLRANISLSPSSHRVRENLDRNAVSPTTRDLDRERESVRSSVSNSSMNTLPSLRIVFRRLTGIALRN